MEEGGDGGGEGEEATEDGRDVGVDIFSKLRTQFTEFSLVRFVRNDFWPGSTGNGDTLICSRGDVLLFDILHYMDKFKKSNHSCKET